MPPNRRLFNCRPIMSSMPPTDHPIDEDSSFPDMEGYEPLDPVVGAEEGAGGADPFESEPVVEERKDEVSLPRPSEPDSIRFSRLREKAKTLPSTPGVYLMKD